MTEPGFELRVELRGPEHTVYTAYGTRTERDTLATLVVPVDEARGWMIYQEAIQRAVTPETRIEFPEGMSAEDAERLREEYRVRRL